MAFIHYVRLEDIRSHHIHDRQGRYYQTNRVGEKIESFDQKIHIYNIWDTHILITIIKEMIA